MFNSNAMISFRQHTVAGLRLGARLLFMLSLLLQLNGVGYTEANCSTFAGLAACNSGSPTVAESTIQNSCCCPEITLCYGLAPVTSIAVAEMAVTKWKAPVSCAQVRYIEVQNAQLAFAHPRSELDIVKPPLHILKSSLLI